MPNIHKLEYRPVAFCCSRFPSHCLSWFYERQWLGNLARPSTSVILCKAIKRIGFQMNHPLFSPYSLLARSSWPKNKLCLNAWFVFPLVKRWNSTLTVLAYGVSIDFYDECVRIGERIIIKNQKKFCKMVDTIFPNEYLIGRQITLTLLGWHLLKWKKCLTTLGMAILPYSA